MGRVIGFAIVWPGESGPLYRRGWGFSVIGAEGLGEERWGFRTAEEARRAGAARVAELHAAEGSLRPQPPLREGEVERAEDAVAYDGGVPQGGV